jgi:phosphoglycolate phosphatase
MKLVIFDCDGTLVDSQLMICAAMSKAYEAQGLPCPPRETVLSIVGLSLNEAFKKLSGGAGHPIEPLIESYKTAFQELRRSDVHMEPLYPGAREALDALAARKDVVLGIATGKSVRGVKLVLGHHGLYERFATVQTSDTAPSKPHPEMIERAMRETGIGARDTVMIGDTAFDIEMARAAGVGTVGVSWGYHPAEELRAAGAEIMIDHFAQLLPALDTRWTAAKADA